MGMRELNSLFYFIYTLFGSWRMCKILKKSYTSEVEKVKFKFKHTLGIHKNASLIKLWTNCDH